MTPAPHVVTIAGHRPEIDPAAWVAPGAVVAGQVSIGAECGIWYGAVLRAEVAPITVGARTNLQDGCVVHTDVGHPVVLGTGITVGHRAVVHGCTVGDDVLVGMGAVLMNGVRVGAGSLIAAGAVLSQGTEVPPGSLVAGVPGKVRRELTDEERAAIRTSAESYVALIAHHRAATP